MEQHSSMSKKQFTRRSRRPNLSHVLVTGVAWYTEEEWGRVKNSATDPERFEPTYAEWARNG